MAASGESWSWDGVLSLVGSTAVGKSEVALLLAARLNGEIISVDSMQVYRGMDIGTAKPSANDRARIPHHLIDVVDLQAEFDAAQFVRLAQRAVRDIRAKGRMPILCGGTGLYFKALFDGLGQAPSANAVVRSELDQTPLPELLAELRRCDPLTYQRIDCQNARRVIRAIEVIRITGKAYSLQRADWQAPRNPAQRTAIFGLVRESTDLQNRIEERVETMFRQGLVRETEALLDSGLANNRTALQALGYRQVVEHLHGAYSLPETIALLKTRTRQFAKRQMTWFRRQLPVHWVKVASTDTAEQTAAILCSHISASLWSTTTETGGTSSTSPTPSALS